MKVSYLKFLGLIAAICAIVSCDVDLLPGIGGSSDATPESIATEALSSGGTAFRASIQDALGESPGLFEKLQSLVFSNETEGASGLAAWNGERGQTENLELDYDIVFTDYQVSTDESILNGSIAIAVSEGTSSCSGSWNIADLTIEDGSNDYAITTTGSGIVLQGDDCETMSLDGEVNISGSLSANGCTVSGSVEDPRVNCN